MVTSVELTTMFDVPQRDVSGRLGGVMAEESADTLMELLRRFAICRCGIRSAAAVCGGSVGGDAGGTDHEV